MSCFHKILSVGLAGLLAPMLAFALPGDADRSYGTNGTTIVNFTPLLGADHFHIDVRTTLDNQGRLWAFSHTLHTLSPAQSEVGVGMTRLTRQGHLDTSFGTNGLAFLPLNHFSMLIGVQNFNNQTYVGFALNGIDQDPTVTWQVCRINANGALDTTWFDTGCGTLTLDNYRQQSDLRVDPVSGNVWIVGNGLDSNTGLTHVLLGIFNNTTHQTQVQRYYSAGQSISANQAVPDGSGGLYFSGVLATPANTTRIVMGHLVSQLGGTFSMSLGTPVEFTINSNEAYVSPLCIARTEQGKLQVGVQLWDPSGTQWGTLQYLANGTPDTSYGDNATTQDVVADLSHNGNSGYFAIGGCARGADGPLNMVGSYTFSSIDMMSTETVPTVHRMLPGGFPDQVFGGDATVPGTTFQIAYTGTAMNNFRVFTPPQPRKDLGLSIQVQSNGMLLVSGLSLRGNGENHDDLAVMRLQTEDPIFADGLE